VNLSLLSSVAQLSSRELLVRVKELAAHEREATAVLIAHLAELDRRRLYLAEGYSSLFAYCTQALHLSEHAAYRRIEAARVVRRLPVILERLPVILERLADGSVNLTTVGLLAGHLTSENHGELLDRVRYKRRRAVEELVAQMHPQPPVPPTVRKLPSPAVGGETQGAPPPSLDARPPTAAPTPPAAPPPARPALVAPLAPQRYRVQFTASAEMYQKLRNAQDLLRHQIPDGDLAAIMDRALTALLRDLARQKLAATDRPRGSGGLARGSRHIPAEVKRAVWLRDGGRCAFVGPGGRRCTEHGFLEFHHVVPHGAGGEPTADNLQLRCRAHNQYEAQLYFGPRDAPAVRETRAPYKAPRGS